MQYDQLSQQQLSFLFVYALNWPEIMISSFNRHV